MRRNVTCPPIARTAKMGGERTLDAARRQREIPLPGTNLRLTPVHAVISFPPELFLKRHSKPANEAIKPPYCLPRDVGALHRHLDFRNAPAVVFGVGTGDNLSHALDAEGQLLFHPASRVEFYQTEGDGPEGVLPSNDSHAYDAGALLALRGVTQ